MPDRAAGARRDDWVLMANDTKTADASLGEWPQTIDLGDASLTVRPMTADDQNALLAFFRRVPVEDRLYLKEDVTSPEVVARWVRDLDYTRVLPLLAWDGDRVVGDGSLHRSRAEARRHVGEVRIVIDPAYRHRGVGRTLLQTLVQCAQHQDAQLEKLVFEVVGDAEQPAARTAEALGFVNAATFSAHVRYFEGEPHDLQVYELRLGEPTEIADPTVYMF